MHVVTAAEAAAGAFTMEDVVLPLAGGKVQYPQHQTAQVAKAALQPATASPSPTPETLYDESRLRKQSGFSAECAERTELSASLCIVCKRAEVWSS